VVAWPDTACSAAFAERQAADPSQAIRTSTLAVRVARDICLIVATDRPFADEIGDELLRLHSGLLPYLHSLIWAAVCHDAPLLRPLRYHFPDDPRAHHARDQLMLGAWLLAAPYSVNAGEEGAVYLPAGRWYDWWSGAMIEGPAQIRAPFEPSQPPLYARAGAIVSSAPELRLGDAQPLTIDLYPGNGALTLYEDERYSCDPEQPRCCATSYRQRADGQRLRLAIGARTGGYLPRRRRMVLRVHSAGEAAAIAYPGAHYDRTQRMLTLTLDDDGRARQLEFSLAEM
jgi:hypothetical protein